MSRRLTNLAGHNTSPKWSPEGKKISFDHAAQGECDIFTIDAPRSSVAMFGGISTEVERSLHVFSILELEIPRSEPDWRFRSE
jgi:hypothetical protein